MCKGRRYLHFSLAADQIDALNAFLARVSVLDCYDIPDEDGQPSSIRRNHVRYATFVSRPIREMASYWQGVFQIVIEQSTSYPLPVAKGDS